MPAGTRLVLAAATRRIGPGLLAGGSPWRVLRLTSAGDRWIDRWAAGRPVPSAAGPRRLARRLVEGGLASPRPESYPSATMTVVVPCHDRATGLALTLGALGSDVDTVVVDDGSADPVAMRQVTDGRSRTTLVRRPDNGGPAAARNTGWRMTGTELVAFVDTDCVPTEGWLAALAGHFLDPAVGAVAPRIVPLPTTPATRLTAYDVVRSPLDLGPLPGPVRPRSTVPYVPTAALIVRRVALVALGGFDEALRTGEDVDLVWRLDRAGWKVRYDPDVVVGHPVRPGPLSWLRQRAGYGRAAAPLAVRHGRAVAPLAVSRPSAAAWSLVALGHPVAGALVAAASSAYLALRPGTEGRLPRAELARLALRGHVVAGRGIADAARRAWWPILIGAAFTSRRARRLVAAIAVVPPLLEWRRRRPTLDPLTWTVLRLADDMAYGAGVWSGAIRAHRFACLAPDVSRGSPGGDRSTRLWPTWPPASRTGPPPASWPSATRWWRS